MSTTASTRVLVLSQGYEPLRTISWQRAVALLTAGKCEVLETYNGIVRSSLLAIKIPAVIRLLRLFKRFRRSVKFSRQSVYVRDNFCCQYCGKKKIFDDLTYDHVIPRAHGGGTSFENIVAACGPCNLKKGGRTPAQAGMKLLSQPRTPKPSDFLILGLTGEAPEAWASFIR